MRTWMTVFFSADSAAQHLAQPCYAVIQMKCSKHIPTSAADTATTQPCHDNSKIQLPRSGKCNGSDASVDAMTWLTIRNTVTGVGLGMIECAGSSRKTSVQSMTDMWTFPAASDNVPGSLQSR